MEHHVHLGKILLPVLAAVLLIGVAWSVQSIRSALAQPGDSLPPVAYAGPDQAVLPGAAVTLDGSGSYDPDDELPLSYLWAQSGGPAVSFTTTLSVTAFTAPAVPSVLIFTLVVTDSLGVPSLNPDEVVIRAMGQPEANDDRGPAFTTDEDTAFVTGDVLANDTDPDGQPLSVQSFDASGTLGLVTQIGEPAGSLDTAGFGAPMGYVSSRPRIHAIAIQPDGNILAAGQGYYGGLSLTRYHIDGSVDLTFGTYGFVTNDTISSAAALAIQPDGKIITADSNFAIARFNPDGSLDEAFGANGIARFNVGQDDKSRVILIQPDGKIVLAGDTDTNFVLLRVNADGALDTGFGNNGVVMTDFGGDDFLSDAAIYGDQIIASGYTDCNGPSNPIFALARYNPDGSLDPAFGSGGMLTTSFSNADYGGAIAIQPDAKILLVGTSFNQNSSHFVVARYNPDGSLDFAFGDGGKVMTDFCPGCMDGGIDIALQPDGRILAAGYTIPSRYAYPNFALARYNPDGDLDASFGNAGIVSTYFGDDYILEAIALQSDGGIVAADDIILARYLGGSNNGIFSYVPHEQFESLAAGEAATDTFRYVVTNGLLTGTATVSITITGVGDAPIAMDDRGPAFTTDENTAFLTGDVLSNDTAPEDRPLWVESFDTRATIGSVTLSSGSYGPGGSLDMGGFGAPDGFVTTDYGASDDRVMDVAIQHDSKIIVIGYSNVGSDDDFALARYNPDGSLDASFGENGKVLTDFGYDDFGRAVAIQPDGKIVAVGETNTTFYNEDFALARYNPDGSLDDTFGSNGKLVNDFGGLDHGNAIALQKDGKIIAAGESDADFVLVRFNIDGSLDTSFGSNGTVRTDFGASSYCRTVILQADGKIVATGTSGNFLALVRYNPDGSLDDSFGQGGKATTDFGIETQGESAIIQPDGKIVLTGIAYTEGPDYIALARYETNGDLDPTFGNAGKVITSFGEMGAGFDIAIQPDEKLVVTGFTMSIDYRYDLALVRYNPDGSLDGSFGVGGKVNTDFYDNDDFGNALVLQPDNKILVAGTVWGVNSADSGDFILARYNGGGGKFAYDPNGQFASLSAGEVATDTFTYVVTNGILTDTAIVSITVTGVNDPPLAVDDLGPGFTTGADMPFITGDVIANDQDIDGDPLMVSSFDTSGTLGLVTQGGGLPGSLDTAGFGAPNGFVAVDFGHDEASTAIAIDTSGRIILGGYTYDGNEYDITLLRFNTDGSQDVTFGNNGIVYTDFGEDDFLKDLAIQPDGKIVMAGYAYEDHLSNFALARYNLDGSLDATFGTDGKVTTDFGLDDQASSIAIQYDGKIIVAGRSNFSSNNYHFALARYNLDGSLDTTFGRGGKVITDFGDLDGSLDIAIQPDHKIVLVGYTHNSDNGSYDFALARYNLDGSLDNEFGIDGKVTTDFGNNDDRGRDVAIQADGKIVAAGYVYSGVDDFAMARYNPDGSLDTTFGANGIETTDFYGGDDQGYAIAIQPNDKILVAGQAYKPGTFDDFALARYLPDGSLDDNFGYSGLVTTDITGNYDWAVAMALQPNGMVVLAGISDNGSSQDFTLARYHGDDSTFSYDPNGQFDYLLPGETATDTFIYVVTDGVLTDTAIVSITVAATVTGANQPPSFTSTPITTAVAAIPYTYTITTTDPDAGDLLTITAPTLPAWLTLTDHGDRTATLLGTPTTPGSYPVVLQVTDGFASATQAFTITVTSNPITPTADLSIIQEFKWSSTTSGIFILTVTNLGPDAAPRAVVSDTFPGSFSGITWNCQGNNGAACTASGSGDLYDTLLSLPAGSTVIYEIYVSHFPTGSWVNTAEVIAPSSVSDPLPANNRVSYINWLNQLFLPVILRQYAPPGP